MKTIKESVINEIVINKSRFISLIYRVDTVEEIKVKITEIRDLYKDANHYCYAYIIDDIKKSNDDGEPGGTAGVPIMEILNKFGLNYILCVVVRYFGGIKLGAGGLVRAYSKAAREALVLSSFLDVIKGYNVVICVDYNKQKDLEQLLLEADYTKEYNDKVIYNINCETSIKEKLERLYAIDSIAEINLFK